MDKKIVIALGAIVTIILSGCVAPTSQTFTYGTNKSLTYPFKSGFPVPAENEWVTIKNAEGVQLCLDSDIRAHLRWEFLVTIHNREITQIDIYDVTDTPKELILNNVNFAKDGTPWEGWTASHLITHNSDSWLYQDGDTIKVFKFIVHQGKTKKELIQPVRITQRKKREFNEVTHLRNLAYEQAKKNPNSNILIFDK